MARLTLSRHAVNALLGTWRKSSVGVEMRRPGPAVSPKGRLVGDAANAEVRCMMSLRFAFIILVCCANVFSNLLVPSSCAASRGRFFEVGSAAFIILRSLGDCGCKGYVPSSVLCLFEVTTACARW